MPGQRPSHEPRITPRANARSSATGCLLSSGTRKRVRVVDSDSDDDEGGSGRKKRGAAGGQAVEYAPRIGREVQEEAEVRGSVDESTKQGTLSDWSRGYLPPAMQDVSTSPPPPPRTHIHTQTHTHTHTHLHARTHTRNIHTHIHIHIYTRARTHTLTHTHNIYTTWIHVHYLNRSTLTLQRYFAHQQHSHNMPCVHGVCAWVHFGVEQPKQDVAGACVMLGATRKGGRPAPVDMTPSTSDRIPGNLHGHGSRSTRDGEGGRTHALNNRPDSTRHQAIDSFLHKSSNIIPPSNQATRSAPRDIPQSTAATTNAAVAAMADQPFTHDRPNAVSGAPVSSTCL